MRNANYTAIYATVIFVFFSFALRAGEERVWTAKNGSATFEGTMLDSDGTVVRLKKSGDGKIISVPLEKLSLADQVYVKKNKTDQSKENPFEDPANETDDATKNSDESEAVADGLDREARPVNFGLAKIISPDDVMNNWSVEPDPSKSSKVDLTPRSIRFSLGPAKQRTEISDLCFASAKPEKVLLSSIEPDSGRENFLTTLCLGDIRANKTATKTFSHKLKVTGLSPDGTRAACIQSMRGTFGRAKWLVILDLADPAMPCIAKFTPFESADSDNASSRSTSSTRTPPSRLPPRVASRLAQQNAQRNAQRGSIPSRNENNPLLEVDWAVWTGNNTMIVKRAHAHGSVISLFLLDVQKGTAIWAIQDINSHKIFFSPDKKYFLAQASEHVRLFETATGKALGLLEKPEGVHFSTLSRFAFSPSGKWIATANDSTVHLWDATTGKLTKSFAVWNVSGSNEVTEWVDDTFLLVGSTLINVDRECSAWNFYGTERNDAFENGLYWSVQSEREKSDVTLRVTPIPMEKIKAQFSKPDDELFAVKPGGKVKLVVAEEVPEQQFVAEMIKHALTQNGLVVAEDAPTVVSVGMKTLDPITVDYKDASGMFGFSLRFAQSVGKVPYTPYEHFISVDQEGKTLWANRLITPIPRVTKEELEKKSLEELVKEKNTPKAHADWFLKVRVPAKITKVQVGKSDVKKP